VKTPLHRPTLIWATVAAALFGMVTVAHGTGWIIGNATPSVRPGLYFRSGPDTATHVTFCPGERRRRASWYGESCSPDRPGGPRVLKRVAGIHGDLVKVEGDGPRALDSRFIVPVRLEEVRGWWIPVMRVGGRR